MITKDQLSALSKRYQINEAAILREYAQLYFLARFYEAIPPTKNIF